MISSDIFFQFGGYNFFRSGLTAYTLLTFIAEIITGHPLLIY